jgi:hypothetical protein
MIEQKRNKLMFFMVNIKFGRKGFRGSGFQGFRVSEFQGFRVSGVQGFSSDQPWK